MAGFDFMEIFSIVIKRYLMSTDKVLRLDFMGNLKGEFTGQPAGLYKIEEFPLEDKCITKLKDAAFKIRGKRITTSDFIPHLDGTLGTVYLSLPIHAESLAQFHYDIREIKSSKEENSE